MIIDGEEYISSQEAGKLLNVHSTTINNWCRAGHLDRISWENNQTFVKLKELQNLDLSTIGIGGRRLKWNWDFFKDQNEVSAYWAGFVMADGCLSVRKNKPNQCALSIRLSTKDLDHLYMFCDDIELDRQYAYLRNYEGHDGCGFSLRYSLLKEHFLQWGIVPDKTNNFIEPIVQRELLGHYLRGWFDGDGCVSHNHSVAKVKFTGNKEALIWVRDILYDLGLSKNIHLTKLNDNPKFCNIEICKYFRVKEFYEILYGSNLRRMNRKWLKVEDMINNPIVKTKLSREQTLEVYKEFISGVPSTEICKKYNITYQAIWSMINRPRKWMKDAIERMHK